MHELFRYPTLKFKGILSYRHSCDKEYAGELVLPAVSVETGGNL